jgi:2,3-bisphosphoglycerate-independent phosphoglycerate mutase
VVICFNYRSDRMRELVTALGIKREFDFTTEVKGLNIVQMTQYDAKFPFSILFPPTSMKDILAEWISKHGLKQYHTAETEKFAHVTFFFNGGREEPFPNESRKMMPSPKVATYDLQPAMSAALVKDSVIEALSGGYDFVMCNLAPPDMVGHTGVFDATVEACTVTDQIIGQILSACQRYGYSLVITSDHGNAEEMLDESGNVQTKHSHNFVPLNIACNPALGVKLLRAKGGLSDVAPTVLTLMGLSIPPAMKGTSLISASNIARVPLPESEKAASAAAALS